MAQVYSAWVQQGSPRQPPGNWLAETTRLPSGLPPRWRRCRTFRELLSTAMNDPWTWVHRPPRDREWGDSPVARRPRTPTSHLRRFQRFPRALPQPGSPETVRKSQAATNSIFACVKWLPCVLPRRAGWQTSRVIRLPGGRSGDRTSGPRSTCYAAVRVTSRPSRCRQRSLPAAGRRAAPAILPAA